MSWKAHLERSYFDLRSSISYQYLKKGGKYKVSWHPIRKWLRDVDAYSLQRPQRFKLKTNGSISQGIDALWDADLADVPNLAKHNTF